MTLIQEPEKISSKEIPPHFGGVESGALKQIARSTPLVPAGLRQRVRPSAWQEAVRSWITLIPLATAVCGAAAIQMLPMDQYVELLPPLFFVGALIVTTAMLHQRHLLRLNFKLTDELEATHERLNTLRHLSVELSTSLNASQVAQSVLDHAVQFTNARCGGLWLHTEITSPEETRLANPTGRSSQPCGCSDGEGEKRWRLFAVSDSSDSNCRAHIEEWRAALERGGPELEVRDDFICVPIAWKGVAEGAIFMSALPRPCSEEGEVLLKNIALIAGPSLQNALLYQSMSERAEIDGLTRLLNHRAIQERLNQELARVRRARDTNPDIQFSVATMDITDFKLFNDTYGHAVGDEVLRRVSGCLQQTFRASDIVGRFGGDEFLALLPDTPSTGARALCERVVQLITAEPFLATDGSPITIRLTCGVATYGEDGVTSVELLRAADERMYEAKRKGHPIVEPTVERPVSVPVVLKPDWSSIGLLDALITTIDAKDHYTRSHCERVWRYALLIGDEMGFLSEMMEAVHLCSMVHDVGKIVIPDAILRKPGRLRSDEIEVMQRHTLFGAMIVRELPHLPIILGGVRHHHEHWDGSGYPDKLVGDEIPLLGRVLAVADGFAAMTLQRPYRRALTAEQALREVEAQKEIRYDPAVVEAFAAVMRAAADEDETLQEILAAHEIAYLEQNEARDAAGENAGAANDNGVEYSAQAEMAYSADA